MAAVRSLGFKTAQVVKVGQGVSISSPWSHAWRALWMIRLIRLLEIDSVLPLFSLDLFATTDRQQQ